MRYGSEHEQAREEQSDGTILARGEPCVTQVTPLGGWRPKEVQEKTAGRIEQWKERHVEAGLSALPDQSEERRRDSCQDKKIVKTQVVTRLEWRGPGYFMSGPMLQKIGVLRSADIYEVEQSGQYEIAEWGSSALPKRLDLYLGNRIESTLEYRPHDSSVRVYLKKPYTVGEFHETYCIKELFATLSEFIDPYRGVRVELLDTTTDTALVQVDLFVCGNGVTGTPDEAC